MTRIFNILGLNAKPEEIGFTSSTESAGNMEEVCFFSSVLGYATLKVSLIQNAFTRSSFLPKCQPKNFQISALEVYYRVGQKSGKILGAILGEKMTS